MLGFRMSSTRNFKSPGVFANAALTSIPPTPIAGVPYRDAVSGAAQVAQGWPYGLKVDSKDFNQLMFQWTSLLDLIDKQGIPGWTNLVDYVVPAAVFGSDGKFYLCTSANGPASTVQDPTTSPAFWKAFDPAGYLSSAVGVAINDAGGAQRMQFTSGGVTAFYGQGATPIAFRNGAGTLIGVLSSAGVFSPAADAVAVGDAVRYGQVLGGAGQSTQDVTGSRVSGTTYTNSTGHPIFIDVNIQLGPNQTFSFSKNGTVVRTMTNNTGVNTTLGMSTMVANGQTYSLATPGGSITSWFEHR